LLVSAGTAGTAEAGSVRLDACGPVVTVALDHPAKRNALSPAMLWSLAETVRSLSDREDLRVVVLRGAGDSPFSAGYDLGELPDRPVTGEEARAIHAPIRAAVAAIGRCRHPVVAAVRGFALGAALELMLSCDLRVASEDTQFGLPVTRWGFLYPYEGIRQFIETIGLSHTTSLLLLGDMVDAARAYEMGLVHRVIPGDRFDAEVEAAAAAVGQAVPLAVRETKALLQRARWDAQPSAAFLEDVYLRIAACLGSQESRARRASRQEARSAAAAMPGTPSAEPGIARPGEDGPEPRCEDPGERSRAR
jgi:enoyl-CoA hydratase